jgi:hypothetical protein
MIIASCGFNSHCDYIRRYEAYIAGVGMRLDLVMDSLLISVVTS